MGKKVRNPIDLLGEPISQKKYTDPLEMLPGAGPMDRQEAQSYNKQDTFKSDSDYDTGLGFGVDQDKLRARNQGLLDELGNLVPQTIGGIGLGVLENIGYLGDLAFDWDNSKDYTNALVEIAKKGREKLNESNPIYREDNDTWSLGDSAWWVQNAQGLLESIGEFGITGIGGGGLLSKGAKLLAKGLGTGTTALQAGAQVLTASALAEVEGAMSGANIYKEVYEKELGNGSSPEYANEIASDAAAKTVRLNTVLNTALNLTSIAPLFKTTDKLTDAVKSQLHRLPNETTEQFIKRVDNLATTYQSPKAKTYQVLGREAAQEGVEEDVNLFAEGEGRITGGLEQATSNNPIERFFGKALSSEGALNFVLGAVGGVGQTALVNYAPLYKNEKGDRISLESLNRIKENTAIKESLSIFKNDLEHLVEKQKALTSALASGNEVEIEQAKRDLFDVSALKSIRNDTVEPLVNELNNIAKIDNTNEDEKGQTQAMLQGLAKDKYDNSYRNRASKLAADLPQLAKEYRNLKETIPHEAVLNEVFRKRLNISQLENAISDWTQERSEIEAELAKISDPISLEAVGATSALKANKDISSYLNKRLEKEGNENFRVSIKRSIEALQNELQILEAGYSETIKKGKSINSPLVKKLDDSYEKITLAKTKLNEAKIAYNNEIKNAPKIAKELNKQIETLIQKQIDNATDKQVKQEQQAETTSLVKAQESTEQTPTEKPIPDGGNNENEITPEVTAKVKELAEHITQGGFVTGKNIDFYNKYKDLINKEVEAINSKDNNIPIKEEVKTVSTAVLPNEYEGRKETIEKAEEDEINNQNKTDNKIYGNHNKIAYAAKEKSTDGDLTLNSKYKILHSSSFNVGTEIVLKVDKEYKDYEKFKDDIGQVPIGIYHKDTLIGYYPLAADNTRNLLIREYIIKQGQVLTKITNKTTGKLLKSDKVKTLDAFPIIPDFAIGIEGKYYIDKNITYKNSPTEISEEGYVYAMIPMPNGKMARLSIDIDKVSDEVALSVSNAINIYLNKDTLNDNQKQIINKLFDDYGYNITTKEGLRNYLDNFIRTTDLNDPKIVAIYNKKDSDIHRLSIQGNSVYYMKKGVALKSDKGPKAPEFIKNNPDAIYNHIKQMFARIDVARIKTNKPFKVPLINVNNNTISVSDYEVKDYKTYIAQNTSTNLRAIKLSETEQTVTVQPSLFFDVSFIEAGKENKSIETATKPKQKAILGTNKGFSSQITKSPLTAISPDQVDLKDAEELKENCSKGVTL